MDPETLVGALHQLVASQEEFQQQVRSVVSRIGDQDFEGSSLDGQVVATVSGTGTLRSIHIDVLAKRRTDNLSLGEAVTEAVNSAERLARTTLVDEIMNTVTGQPFGAILDPDRIRLFLAT